MDLVYIPSLTFTECLQAFESQDVQVPETPYEQVYKFGLARKAQLSRIFADPLLVLLVVDAAVESVCSARG